MSQNTDLPNHNPPQAPEIERAILGAMLIDKEAAGRAIELINAETFYKPPYQAVFIALVDLFNENIPIDQLSVVESLRKRGQLELVGGEATIAALMIETASAANIEHHCDILKEKSVLRKIIGITSAYQNMCYEAKENPSLILEQLQSQLTAVMDGNSTKLYSSMFDVMMSAHQEITERYNSRGIVRGVPTGLTRLDKITDGWQPGQFIVIAAKTAMGKTALALDLAKNASSKGLPVAIFSMEMPSRDIGIRLIGNESRREVLDIHNVMLTTEDWKTITDASNRLSQYPIFIDDTPGLTLPRFLAKLRRMIKERNIKLAIVDYIQLMQGTNKETRRLEVESISRGLKQYAMKFNIPIIALSQFSRKADEREGKPRLSDLRESGSIEQDGDIVIFINDPPKEEKMEAISGLTNDQQAVNIRELLIRKNRNGRTGKIYVYWDGRYTRFSTLNY